MVGLLTLILLYIFVTSILATVTRGREVNVFGKRCVFTIAGFLLYLGKERVPRGSRRTPRPLSMAMVVATFIGMVLFYAQMLPVIIGTIARFFAGGARGGVQPTVVPLPLLFTYTSIVPYLLLSIGVAIAVHEVLHAVMALRSGIKVKSWGFGVIALIPIAFVEVDEQQFEASPRLVRASVLGAGPFANAVVALAALALFMLSTHVIMATAQPALVIHSVNCGVCYGGCPAKEFGLRSGEIIASVNGVEVHSVTQLRKIVESVGLGGRLRLTLCSFSGSCRNVTLVLNAWFRGTSRPCIGIEIVQSYAVFSGSRAFIPPTLSALVTFARATFFLFVVNYSVFVFNAIPLVVTDGSKLLRVLSEGRPKLKKLLDAKLIDVLNAVAIGLAMAISTYIFIKGA